jgi:hypothetical protein
MPLTLRQFRTDQEDSEKGLIFMCLKYRVTQKKRELLKNTTKIEEIQEKKIIDRN